ncbi:MAG TPA: hypothetical protein VJL60_05320, partial [Gammaproteobacteria bacterium]|nr:hypothetical protein [Gammaproteobacteria bacterium]
WLGDDAVSDDAVSDDAVSAAVPLPSASFEDHCARDDDGKTIEQPQNNQYAQHEETDPIIEKTNTTTTIITKPNLELTTPPFGYVSLGFPWRRHLQLADNEPRFLYKDYGRDDYFKEKEVEMFGGPEFWSYESTRETLWQIASKRYQMTKEDFDDMIVKSPRVLTFKLKEFDAICFKKLTSPFWDKKEYIQCAMEMMEDIMGFIDKNGLSVRERIKWFKMNYPDLYNYNLTLFSGILECRLDPQDVFIRLNAVKQYFSPFGCFGLNTN